MFRSFVDWRCVLVFALVCTINSTVVRTRLIAQPPILNPTKPVPVPAVNNDPLTPDPSDDELRTLLKERYNSAAREYAMLEKRVELGFDPAATAAALEQRFSNNRRRAEVALELYPKTEDQVHILQKLLADAKELEKKFIARSDAGGVGVMPQDLERVHGARLDVEIMLVKAKQKAKAAK